MSPSKPHLGDVRLDSFKPGSRKKAALGWPLGASHSVNAHSLSAAGFYFTPTPETRDAATCFMCSAALMGWEANDDPLTEHLRHVQRREKNCGWAKVMLAQRQARAKVQLDAMPDSEEMVLARLATFGSWWPHDKKKTFLPKSHAMASAGFYFTGTSDSLDNAACCYCDVQLDGWAKNDVPEDEHRKRSPNCAMFAAPPVPPKSKSRKTKTVSAEEEPPVQKTALSRTRAHHSLARVASADEIDKQPPEPEQPAPSAKAKKAKAPTAPKRSSNVVVEIAQQPPAKAKEPESTPVEIPAPEPAKVVKKPTKSKKPSTASTIMADDEEQTATTSKPKRVAKKKASTATRKAPARKTSSKAASAPPAEVEDPQADAELESVAETEDEVQPELEEAVPPPSKIAAPVQQTSPRNEMPIKPLPNKTRTRQTPLSPPASTIQPADPASPRRSPRSAKDNVGNSISTVLASPRARMAHITSPSRENTPVQLSPMKLCSPAPASRHTPPQSPQRMDLNSPTPTTQRITTPPPKSKTTPKALFAQPSQKQSNAKVDDLIPLELPAFLSAKQPLTEEELAMTPREWYTKLLEKHVQEIKQLTANELNAWEEMMAGGRKQMEANWRTARVL